MRLQPIIAATLTLVTGVARGQETSATWYRAEIAPILEASCTGCHGPKRQRGGLALDTPEAIAKGGDGGSVLAARGDDGPGSELLARIRLPLEHDDHMPPEGRAQLGDVEIAALVTWIEAGASFDAPPPATATPTVTVVAQTTPPPVEALARVRGAHVHIEIIDPDTNGLWIDFAAMPTLPRDAVVDLLRPLAPWTTELSLRGMAHAHQVLATIGSFPRLRSLDLGRAHLDGPALAAAAQGGALEELSLIEATLTIDAVGGLFAVASLEHMHVWGSNLPPQLHASLQSALPTLTINDGSVTAPAPIEVEPPFTLGIIAIPPALVPINTTCPVSGAPIVAKFSVVHEGRVVAFCCEKCAAAFWADPAAHEIVADNVVDPSQPAR
ncbi:MAG: c-type cytochrome domain-containing protein [Planctomycetota bacterium]|jgi:mono/diheme cytochrome c family protein